MQRRRRPPRRVLEHQHAASRALTGRGRHQIVEIFVIIRRIEEHDLERSAGDGRMQRAAGVDAQDHTLLFHAQPRAVLGNQRLRAAILLEADGRRRAPAERFQRHRTGASVAYRVRAPRHCGRPGC